MFNTILLLSSGATLTTAHIYLLCGFNDLSGVWTLLTVILGVLFLFVQYHEYKVLRFTIADGIYGSCFYMLTGFHGLHVMGGVIFLLVNVGRIFAFHFSCWHHVGYECAIWYWHFVDIVWIFLFVWVYIWGS